MKLSGIIWVAPVSVYRVRKCPDGARVTRPTIAARFAISSTTIGTAFKDDLETVDVFASGEKATRSTLN